MFQIYSNKTTRIPNVVIYYSKKALFVLVIFSILSGYLINIVVNEKDQKHFIPNWENANWITPQTESTSGYFRYSLILQEPVIHANITLSATEEFVLTVNEKIIKRKKLLLNNISGIFDISKHLQPGKNVIAINVTRHTKGTIPAIIAKINWQDSSNNTKSVYTNENWISNYINENNPNHLLSWSDINYNDLNWEKSRKLLFSSMDTSYPVNTAPSIYKLFPTGQWISGDTVSNYTIFNRKLYLDTNQVNSAWLGVSANGDYSLSINNVLVTTEESSLRRMDLINITPFISRGNNVINIKVVTNTSIPKLLASGVVLLDDSNLFFSSDRKWSIVKINKDDNFLNTTSLIPSNTPALNSLEISTPDEISIINANRISIYSGIILLITLMFYYYFIRYNSCSNKNLNISALIPAYLSPYINISLLFISLILIKNSYPVFESYNFILYSLVIALFTLFFYKSIIIFELSKTEKITNITKNTINLFSNEKVCFLTIILIASLAFSLRIWTLGDQSFFQDESTILQFTHGLIEKGYPFLYRDIDERLMVTYELMPYMIAASITLFGDSEFAARLPSVFFSMGTLALIIYISQRWYNQKVALLAALLYAITPWAIFWAQNCFYPAQIQFFALASTYFFIKLLKSDNEKVRDWYLLALFFCCTYLTWEGSGLLLLVYGFMWLPSNRWDWFKNTHFWLTMIIVGSVVFTQLYLRTMQSDPFLLIGSGKANITTPQLAFTLPDFDPFYYLDNIFLSEQYLLLSCFFVIGFIFFLTERNFKQPYFFVLLTIATYTLFLPVTAIRYVYFVLPFFLTGISATTIKIFEISFSGNISLFTVNSINKFTQYIVIILLFLSAGSYFFKPGELSKDEMNIPTAWEIRNDIQSTDYRGIINELEKRYRTEDIVITRAPFLLDEYSEIKGNFSIQSLLTTLVVYGIRDNDPFYRDKWKGNPVLRNIQELEDILYRNKRVWLLAAPTGTFLKSLDTKVLEFIDQNFILKAETDHAKLYLWEK